MIGRVFALVIRQPGAKPLCSLIRGSFWLISSVVPVLYVFKIWLCPSLGLYRGSHSRWKINCCWSKSPSRSCTGHNRLRGEWLSLCGGGGSSRLLLSCLSCSWCGKFNSLPCFLLSAGLENKPSMSGGGADELLNMERYHKVAIEVAAIDWLIGEEYKSERTSDRD